MNGGHGCLQEMGAVKLEFAHRETTRLECGVASVRVGGVYVGVCMCVRTHM